MPYKDPAKQKEAQHIWYEQNVDVAERSRLQREKKHKWIDETKVGKPCADCGVVFDPRCMDYHHVDASTKLFTVSRGAMMVGRKALEAEIAKCEIVCSNCYRLRHK